MKHNNKCNGCGRPFLSGAKVVALIPFISVKVNKSDESEIRLEISDEGINSRAVQVFCDYCVNPEDFGITDTKKGV